MVASSTRTHEEVPLRIGPGFIGQVLGIFRRLIEAAAAALVMAEVAILLAGVIMRYVFLRPLSWSDELASIIFIWLVMLGALIALMRGQHMRMTALVGRFTGARALHLERITYVLMAAFLLALAIPGYDYVYDESFITTPALSISNAWTAAAIPTCAGLMAIFLAGKLLQMPNRIATLGVILAVAAATGLLILAQPLLGGLGNWNLVLFFVVLVAVGVCGGVPIAFIFGLSTVAYLGLTTSTPMTIVIGRMGEGMAHLILLAVPLFVLLGYLIGMTGMAAAMVQFLSTILGNVRGGLSYVLIGAMYLVSGISGSKTADMAAIAPALFPEMRARGAKPGELVALLSATGAQTETIPPSLVLIAISSATGVSIAALFTGGFLPGIVLGVMLCLLVWWRHSRDVLDHVRSVGKLQILKGFLIALPALALPFIIRAAVMEGVATATEVSTIGIVYAVVCGVLLYRRFDVSKIFGMLVDTAALSGAILFIIGAATAMAWALTQSGFAASLARAMSSLPGGHVSFLVVSVAMFIVLGSLLEGIPAIVLFGPLLFPIARSLGVHEVQYAMIVILSMGIGLFAPPFGVGYYAACAISGVDPNEGMRPILKYLVMLLIGIVIVAAVPWLSIGFL